MNFKKFDIGILLAVGSLLLVGNAFGAPVPPPPTPVGGALWPYVTAGVAVGCGAWKLWKN